MPLVFIKEFQGFRIGLWRILEATEELLTLCKLPSSDIAGISSWKSESRRRQWIACRALLAALSGSTESRIIYDQYGKPSVSGAKGSISISHTAEYAVMMISERASCGIDIEKISSRIQKVANRFLQEQETAHLEQISSADHSNGLSLETGEADAGIFLKVLTVHWAAKEALYKYYGSPETDMKNDIYIGAFDYFCKQDTIFPAWVRTNGARVEHGLQSMRIEDHIMVFTLF